MCMIMIFFTKVGVFSGDKKWIVLAAISSPVLLGMVSTAKPFLLPCAMTTSALMVINFKLAQPSSGKILYYQRKSFFLVMLLAITAATMKANFLLSGAVIVGLALFISSKQKPGSMSFVLADYYFLLSYFHFLWKHIYFGSNGVFDFFSVLPGSWPGYENFKTMLTNYRDTSAPFPLSLIFPTGLGSLTLVLGVGVFYLLSFVKAANF